MIEAEFVKYLKAPDEVLDFVNDWSDFLVDDTITVSTWFPPADLTLVSSSNTPTRATVWLADGTLGTVHRVVNRIETAGGRTAERTIHIQIDRK